MVLSLFKKLEFEKILKSPKRKLAVALCLLPLKFSE